MARHWQIVEADKALRFAEAEYKVRVEMAAKDLAEAKSPRLLAQIGSVSLTETSLEVDGRSISSVRVSMLDWRRMERSTSTATARV